MDAMLWLFFIDSDLSRHVNLGE